MSWYLTGSQGGLRNGEGGKAQMSVPQEHVVGWRRADRGRGWGPGGWGWSQLHHVGITVLVLPMHM